MPSIEEWVREQYKRGYSPQQIKGFLEDSDWDPSIVNEILGKSQTQYSSGSNSDLGFLEKVKGFLFHPSESFRKVKGEGLKETIKYFVPLSFIYTLIFAGIFAVIFSVVGGIMSLFLPDQLSGFLTGMQGFFLMLIPLLFVFMLISLFLSAFLGGVVLHIMVLLLGGSRGIKETIKVVMYSMTPFFLLGWIPIVNFLAGIWALIVEVKGLEEIQELSTGRAIMAILFPFVVFGIFYLLVTTVVGIGSAGAAPTPYGPGPI